MHVDDGVWRGRGREKVKHTRTSGQCACILKKDKGRAEYRTSLDFSFTEASKCTRKHRARGQHPGRHAAAEAWCVGPSACFYIHMQNTAMYSLTDIFTLLVTLRPRLVTWGRSHGIQERAAKVPVSWEDKEWVDLSLLSCALVVHSVPTTASTNADSLVNGLVQFTVEAVEAVAQDSIKTSLEAHGDVFDLEVKGESVVARLISATHSTL